MNSDSRYGHPTVIRLLVLTGTVVFSVEFLIMLLLDKINGGYPALSPIIVAITDASLLLLVLFPFIYGLIYRPFINNLVSLDGARAQLAGQQKHLEEQIRQRTDYITEVNKSLAAEIAERRQAEGMLLKIAENVSVKTGSEFFMTLVKFLSEETRKEYALIGELIDGGQTVSTLSVFANGAYGENFSYSLADTPCADVIEKQVCFYGSGIQEQFPEDRLLVDMGAHSYSGIPLFDSAQRPIGIIAVLGKSPMTHDDEDKVKSLLQIFGMRAASELERRNADAALRESERKFREISELLPEIVFETDEKGMFTFVNENFRNSFGQSDEEAGNKMHCLDIVSSSDREHTRSIIDKGLSGARIEDFECALSDKDGHVFPAIINLSPIMQGEDVVGLRGIALNISERKESEQALARSELKYRTIFESAGSAIMIVEEDGTISLANRELETMTGHSKSDIEGQMKWSEFFSPESAGRIEGLVSSGPETSASAPRHYETNVLTKDGRELTVSLTLSRMPDGRQRLLSFVDISEQIRLKEEAVHTSHLASLGELAAGVAHEINNPISTIMLNAQMALTALPAENDSYKDIMQIVKESDRISGIVKSLLSFARQEKDEPLRVSVSDVISETLSVTEHLFRKEGARVTIDIPEQVPEIYVNPKQMEQVFVNILINARHALNQKYPGGHEDKLLEISAEGFLNEQAEPMVRVVFHDHGAGMPPDVLKRALNPFFTTKPSKSGTGLGLSISHGIVTDNHGTLRLVSVEGRYTKVIIELPAVKEGYEA